MDIEKELDLLTKLKFKISYDGYFTYNNGGACNTLEEIYQTEILNFCGCGMPDENLKFIKDVLELIEYRRSHDEEKETWDEFWDKYKIKELELYSDNEGLRYFIWYVFDSMGITDHGGSVPGWLTPLGKNLLHDLKLILEDARTN